MGSGLTHADVHPRWLWKGCRMEEVSRQEEACLLDTLTFVPILAAM